MITKNIQQILNELAFSDVADVIDAHSREHLISFLDYCDHQYFNVGDSAIDDATYDIIDRVIRPKSETIGSETSIDKVELPMRMGSLTQTQLGGDLQRWMEKHNLTQADLCILPKYDGVSGLLSVRDGVINAYTRGDGIHGQLITDKVYSMHNMKDLLSGDSFKQTDRMIRGEFIIIKSDKEEFDAVCTSVLGRSYKNLRNAVAGLLNRQTSIPDANKFIRFVAYELVQDGYELSKKEQLTELQKMGFQTATRVTVNTHDTFSENDWVELTKDTVINSEYELDGIVIEVNDYKLRQKINPTTDTLNPEYSRKFKVGLDDNHVDAEVIEVEWNVSKHGYLKPRVVLKPFELDGVTIQHATGFNAEFIRSNSIGSGAIVRVVRSGGVIPYITNTITPSPTGPQMPTTPYQWNDTKIDIFQDATDNVTSRILQMVEFFKSMKIEQIGEGNATKLYYGGMETISDVLNASESHIISAVNSSLVGTKIFESIHKVISTKIPEYQIAGSTTIFGRGIGVRKLKSLWEYAEGNWDELLVNSALIAQCEGFDVKTANQISSSANAYFEFRDSISNVVQFSEFEAKPTGAWTGKQVVFSGIRDKRLEQLIESVGGVIGSGVSKKTTYLIVDDLSSMTSKATKATQLSIPIVTIDEFMEIFNNV